ncbi:MAG: FHA domain-containing protein [Atopobiaceae bacterium]|nr:FHA domain-containing protein [Atopobiaceae bacterium]
MQQWAEDDILTEYIGSTGQRNEPDESADRTVVFGQPYMELDVAQVPQQRPACVLMRARTGEQIVANPPAVIGRGNEATSKVRGNLAISRTHARLDYADGHLTICDLGSVNGTRVRGIRIPAHTPIELHDGDEVHLASEPFLVRLQLTS